MPTLLEKVWNFPMFSDLWISVAETFSCAGGSARVALGSGMAHPRVADATGDDSYRELFALQSAIGPNAKSCSSLARNFHKITAWMCASGGAGELGAA